MTILTLGLRMPEKSWMVRNCMYKWFKKSSIFISCTLSHKIGGIYAEFMDSNRSFHHCWVDYGPSTKVLPQGYQRDPDHRAVTESIIWEKDVDILMRDGVRLRADVFCPAKLHATPLPPLLAWSPCGKTGVGKPPMKTRKWTNVS